MDNRPIHVLLIEDNPGDVRLIQEMLKHAKTASFVLESKARLSEGLDRLSRGGVEVVLLDLSLPDSSGLETFSKVQSGYPLVPTIPLTGLDDELLAVRAVRAGAQDYLIKGEVDTNLLTSAIRYAIERKKVEEALRQSEKRYRTLFQSTGTATVVVQSDSTISLANAEFEKLSGYSKEELEGKIKWQHFVVEDYLQSLTDYARQTAVETDNVPRTFDFQFVDRWEKTKDVFMTAARIPEGQGFVASLLDISERKKMEDELLRTKKLESIGILAGGIAHDFNNILTAILGSISLARLYSESDDKLSAKLNEAEKGAMRAQELTRQLLTFSKGGAPIRQTTSIPDWLREQAAFALAGSNVGCEFSIPDDTWPVLADQGQLSQVLSNILLNADQAMPSGGMIVVKTDNIVLDGEATYPDSGFEPGKYVRISITDQGIGIPDKQIARVFDPYFSTKPGGSGLGLAIAHSVVEKHKGRLAIESKQGVGTTLHVYLPASEAEVSPVATSEEATLSGTGKVLVMDDEGTIRQLVQEMLTALGYVGDVVSEGQEAVAAYKKALTAGEPYDAVILDLTVPGGMGGKEAIEKLLATDPNVKAIVSSGYANDPIMADHKQYGFQGVVAKPYRIQEFSQTLKKVLASPS
jgi:PAS domain S-box-containing protein